MIKLLGTIISLVLALGFILVCMAIISDLVPWLQGIPLLEGIREYPPVAKIAELFIGPIDALSTLS